jgi:glycosyltransferase involved in cell wall biosynthesis
VAKLDDIMVSCLMVTLPVPERLSFVKRSVEDYCRQTHARKELIIVVDAGAPSDKSAIAAYVSSLGRHDIRIVDPSTKLTLGALRNLSWASARGDVVCQWDDDDRYHPQRLELQLGALLASGSQAVYLQGVMLYFSGSRALYCTNWHATPSKSFPASLLCARSTLVPYPETGPDARIGEDMAVALAFQRAGRLHVLTDAPHLYVYVCHGGNIFARDHYQMLADKLAISRGLLIRREARLREQLRPYDLGVGAVTLQGSNGPAFVFGEPEPPRDQGMGD